MLLQPAHAMLTVFECSTQNCKFVPLKGPKLALLSPGHGCAREQGLSLYYDQFIYGDYSPLALSATTVIVTHTPEGFLWARQILRKCSISLLVNESFLTDPGQPLATAYSSHTAL